MALDDLDRHALYHLATEAEWEDYLDDGAIVPPSLEAVTEMVTTLGDALAATAVTVVALLASLTVMFCGPETVLMVALLPVAE